MLPASFYAYPAFLVIVAVVAGLIVGSFLNVVIHRLPKMLERQWRAECAELAGTPAPPAERYDLVIPRSACPKCGHRISAIENVPLASYIALGGKCSQCKAPISPRYPAVELLSGALAGYIAWRYGLSAAMLGALLFAWALIALTFIDLDTFYLPDSITLPLIWAGLLFNAGGTFTDLRSAVIGAAVGYLALWAVFWAFKFATGKEGMGYGDFKLLAAIGAWLGWKMLPLTILASSLVGAVIGIGLIAFAKHAREKPIPFGPYLAVAGLIAMFWGEPINRYYLNLL
ncbi:MAG TPA: A24 family peptidase [Burkholderiales bacterium]|nr:A24 family peptidase [Burkholderiales bacterium]